MKGKKKKKKSSTMVTKVTKVVTKEIPEDKKDQNFFKKPQMDKASRMASDENFNEKIYEVEVDETNIDDNTDIKEMLKVIEQTFQEMFKNKWDKNLEEEKILRKLATKYPTRSVSDICSDKVILMYIKSKEENVKSRTYHEMMKEEMK